MPKQHLLRLKNRSTTIRSPLYKEGQFFVLVSDGAKQSKEGRRIPGGKRLFQESWNSAKPEYIHGHMFGGLGVLARAARSFACIPLGIRLHDGLRAAKGWEGACISGASHVVQMVEDAYHAARDFGDSRPAKKGGRRPSQGAVPLPWGKLSNGRG